MNQTSLYQLTCHTHYIATFKRTTGLISTELSASKKKEDKKGNGTVQHKKAPPHVHNISTSSVTQ